MDNILPVFLIVVVGSLVLVAAYLAHAAGKRRAAEISALASRLSWRFEGTSFADDPHFAPFGVFSKGHSRSAFNTLRGSIEIDGQRWTVQAGDYQYKTTSHNGKHTTTHTHTLSYAIVETPHLGAPDLFIRREGIFDRVAGFMGFDDIDFESVEFSERYHVKSGDKRFAYAVLDPRMMEFLLDVDPPTIEFRRGLCCLTRGERTWTVEQFAATFGWSREFFSRWPRQVPSVLDS